MDRYALAVRKYMLLRYEEFGRSVDSKEFHVRHEDFWRKYRLYSSWIDGLDVEPRYPPIYILADTDCNVRWMTEKEADEYQKEREMTLLEAVKRLAETMRNKTIPSQNGLEQR